jgi:hypothetical protein
MNGIFVEETQQFLTVPVRGGFGIDYVGPKLGEKF